MDAHAMIDARVRDEIERRLTDVEQSESVHILLAVESGSRAWGFASPDSDYDVRFVYVRDEAWYLAIDCEDKRDVIERDIVDEIDLSGWDLRKALRLFWNSNPGFVEWIQSPIAYRSSRGFVESARSLLPAMYSCEKGILHYRSMASTNYRTYLQQEVVPLKKYFYALRPLLAVRWIESKREPPPIEFERLLVMLDDEEDVQRELRQLVAVKKRSAEMGLAPRIPALNDHIEAELVRLGATTYEPGVPAPIGPLNELFRAMLDR
jgi:predicted nucleotidyltransferase